MAAERSAAERGNGGRSPPRPSRRERAVDVLSAISAERTDREDEREERSERLAVISTDRGTPYISFPTCTWRGTMRASSGRPGPFILSLVALTALIVLASSQPPSDLTKTPVGSSTELGVTVSRSLAQTNTRSANSTTSSPITPEVMVAGGLLRPSDSPRLNCQLPLFPLYDSGANEIFVNCEGSDNVTVISPTNNSVVANIPVGNTFSVSEINMAYDPARGEVFVANKNNTFGNTVSVISDKTNTVIATVTVGQNPSGLTFDSGRGEVFVMNSNSNSLSVISDTTNTVVATIPVGPLPSAVVYDSAAGEVFVPSADSNDMSIVSDATNSVISTIPVGFDPIEGLYDPVKGEVFVLNTNSNNVSVVSDVTNTVVATVRVGSGPDAMAYDSGRGETFVSNYDSASVSVISDVSDNVVATIPTGPGPAYMTYVPTQGEVFLGSIPGPHGGGNNLTVISDSTNRIVATITETDGSMGVAYDPEANELFVPTLSAPGIGPCGYAFDYSMIVISTETNSAVTSIPVGQSPAFYCVTFDETGFDFAGGAEWCFSDNYPSIWECSTVSSAPLDDLPNGTYTYSIWDDHPGQSPVTPTVTFTVRGVPVTLNLTFVAASPATFTETGLPSGASWSVAINGSVALANGSRAGPFQLIDTNAPGSSSIAVSLPNGTYDYTASSSGFGTVQGSLSIRVLEPILITVEFSPTGGPLLLGLPIAGWVVTVSTVIGTAAAVLVARSRKRSNIGMG